MKSVILSFLLLVSLDSSAKDADFASDLTTVKPPAKEPKKVPGSKEARLFNQRFTEDYAGLYNLNPTKGCSLDPNVKKVRLDHKDNSGNPSIRVIFYDKNDQVLENRFYPLSKAIVSSNKSSSKDEMSMRWEAALVKDGLKRTKYERISFAKDVISFDVDRFSRSDAFIDKLFTSSSPNLEKRSKCNFMKADDQKNSVPQSQPQNKNNFKSGVR
jgi:hypothetical protein